MARVTVDDIDVMCVVAVDGPSGGPAAFAALEASLESRRGRKFYATWHAGEYRAFVAIRPDEAPTTPGVATWRIPGGAYERRMLQSWQDRLEEIGTVFEAMVPEEEVDTSRPAIGYYRGGHELVLFKPVR